VHRREGTGWFAFQAPASTEEPRPLS